jgi:hypothetical protein
MDAALKIGTRCSDITVLSELLPAAEARLSRRSVAIEFEMMVLDQTRQCPLTTSFPPLEAHASCPASTLVV